MKKEEGCGQSSSLILHGKWSMPDLQAGAVGEGSGNDFENVIDPTDKKQAAGEKVQDTGSDLSHIKAVNSPIAQKNGQHQRKQLAFRAFIGIRIATHILIIIIVVVIDNNGGLLGIGLLIRLLIRLLVGLLIGILIGLLLRLLIRLVGLLIRVLIGLLLIQLLVGLVRLIRFLIRLLVRVLIRLIRLIRLLTGLLHRLHGSAAIGTEICIFRIRAAIWTEHFLHSLTGSRFQKTSGFPVYSILS